MLRLSLTSTNSRKLFAQQTSRGLIDNDGQVVSDGPTVVITGDDSARGIAAAVARRGVAAAGFVTSEAGQLSASKSRKSSPSPLKPLLCWKPQKLQVRSFTSRRKRQGALRRTGGPATSQKRLQRTQLKAASEVQIVDSLLRLPRTTTSSQVSSRQRGDRATSSRRAPLQRCRAR